MPNPPLSSANIKTALGDRITPLVTTPQVYPFNCLPPELKQYPGLFTYYEDENDLDSIKIHGWTIFRTTRDGRLRSVTGCQDYEWTYNVWGFYECKPNGSIASNSNDEFDVIIDSIAEEINQSPSWTISNGAKPVSTTHTGLKFRLTTILNCGTERLFWAPGQITFKFST